MAVCNIGTDKLITISVLENIKDNWTYLVLLLILLVAILMVYFLWKSRDRLKKIMNQKTNKDVLTGYSNFSQFLDDAGYLLKFKEAHYAIGYIDVNNFKSINDNYGRAQGDRVLRVVADKINDLVVPNGIFARRFADRFVFLIGYMDINSLAYIVDTYLSEIEFRIDGLDTEINIKCNCGIYEVVDPTENIEEMIDKAAIATKISKSTISSSVTVLDNTTSAKIKRNQEITYND